MSRDLQIRSTVRGMISLWPPAVRHLLEGSTTAESGDGPPLQMAEQARKAFSSLPQPCKKRITTISYKASIRHAECRLEGNCEEFCRHLVPEQPWPIMGCRIRMIHAMSQFGVGFRQH